MSKPRLITIPFSHFCEKARWALERAGTSFDEDGHLPMFHYVPVRRAGAHRTVPVLVAGDELIPDSTAIVAWADARRPGCVLPADPRERATALAIEDDLDRVLGPATRRWAYFHLLPRTDLDALVTRGTPRWEQRALKLTRPLAVAMMRRGMTITPEGTERSRTRIEDTFAHFDALLAGGREYLVGDQFSVADLTLAALAAPVLLPPEHPFGIPLDVFPDEARAQIERWRATRSGRHALAMYARERVAAEN